MPRLTPIFSLIPTIAAVSVFGLSLANGTAVSAQAPADGITMEMMPITAEQIKACRDQASQQLSSEQDTLHKREHSQDNDKMKQGAVAGVTGAVTTKLSKGGGGWWGYGNNNGAQTAAATGATERTNRNSADVASTTATSQQVGVDAYSQCVAGIKGPEYVHFRQTGQITAFTGSAPAASAPVPASVAAAAVTPPAPAAASASKSPIQDTGDGVHYLLTAPGQTDAREVTLVPGSKNAYLEEASGDKYYVLADGTVTRVAKHTAPKTTAKN